MRIIKLILLIFLIGGLGLPAHAYITVNFPQGVVTNINQVQYYWSGDANNPNLAGRTISLTKNSVRAEEGFYAAIATDGSPYNMIDFGAWEAPLTGSQSISIRLWDPALVLFTDLAGYSNPTGATDIRDFTSAFRYIKSAPNKPEIIQIKDSLVRPTTGGDDTREIVFVGGANQTKTHIDGKVYTIPIPAISWTVSRNGAQIFSGAGDAANANQKTLRSGDYNPPLSAGDNLSATVTYTNYWAESATSDPANYTIGASGAAAAVIYNVGIRFVGNDIQLTWNSTANNFALLTSTDGANWENAGIGFNDGGDADASTWVSDTYANVTPGARFFRVLPSDAANDPNAIYSEIVGQYVYDLRASTADRTGINSFSMPFRRNWAPGLAVELTSAGQVRDSLNSLTAASFEFVGGWDEGNQVESAFLETDGGNGFDLIYGRGYQLSTRNAVVWKIIGKN